MIGKKPIISTDRLHPRLISIISFQSSNVISSNRGCAFPIPALLTMISRGPTVSCVLEMTASHSGSLVTSWAMNWSLQDGTSLLIILMVSSALAFCLARSVRTIPLAPARAKAKAVAAPSPETPPVLSFRVVCFR